MLAPASILDTNTPAKSVTAELAKQIASILAHPETSAELYNAIVDQITSLNVDP
jgi:hypothetical protein